MSYSFEETCRKKHEEKYGKGIRYYKSIVKVTDYVTRNGEEIELSSIYYKVFDLFTPFNFKFFRYDVYKDQIKEISKEEVFMFDSHRFYDNPRKMWYAN